MIERVEQDTLSRFLEFTQLKNLFACRLHAQLCAFGANTPYADFWLCKNSSGAYWGALGRTGQSFTLYTLPVADWDELIFFLGTVGCGMTLSATVDDCQRIKKAFLTSVLTNGKIMEYKNFTLTPHHQEVQLSEDYKAIYRCICESNTEFSHSVLFDDFYVALYPKKQKNQCFFGEIRKNGRIISTAGLIHMSKTTTIIGCVSTVPEERSKGYASQTVTFVTAEALKRGLFPMIQCKTELIPFYEGLGFIQKNQWGQLLLAF